MTLYKPQGWNLRRFDHLFDERKEKVSDKDFPPLSITMNGIVPQLDTVAKTDDGDNRKLVRAGDYVINSRSDRKGSGGISEYDGSVSLIGIILKPKGIFPRFAHHLLRSQVFQEEFYRWGHGIVGDLWTTRFADTKNIYCFLPNPATQKAIAAFLDRETSRIDELIAKKQRQLELLQEKRTVLISHVVTKGLDPDVKMKDSGVEWLREIPEHWAIHSIKRVSTRIQTGCTPPTAEERYYELGTIPWYGPGSFGTNLILSEPTKLLNEDSVREGAARIFAEDSVMVVTIGATIGKVGYLASPASSNQQITAISPNQNEVSGKFLAYQLKRLEPVLRGIAPSTTLPIIDQQELGSLPCALPSLDEQKRIVQYIDLQSQKIDRMVETIRKSIDLLREYRTALISAAVTGKIDVREEVA